MYMALAICLTLKVDDGMIFHLAEAGVAHECYGTGVKFTVSPLASE